jgi:hypothetical protein
MNPEGARLGFNGNVLEAAILSLATHPDRRLRRAQTSRSPREDLSYAPMAMGFTSADWKNRCAW